MNWAFIFLYFISFNSYSSIFGKDDRVDTRYTDASTQELARSVPALIQNHRIKRLTSNKYTLTGIPLMDLNFCSDEAFAYESIVANCSASLIGPNKVLTAAHCLDGPDYGCSTYSVVFDYLHMGSNHHILDIDQVYQCKRIVHFEFDLTLMGRDLAVIELDRDVVDRTPITISKSVTVGEKLTMIGYPFGISQKVVTSGEVLTYDALNSSFHSNLDSFSVNSGGPIFNESGDQIGVLVRGTGVNYEKSSNESCYRWHRAQTSSEYSAGNDLRSLPSSLLIGK